MLQAPEARAVISGVTDSRHDNYRFRNELGVYYVMSKQ